jgi:hypothetical protein
METEQTIENDNIEKSSEVSKKRAASDDIVVGPFNLDSFVRSDPRIGYPRTRPNIPQFKHGWFFPSHIEMIELISLKVKIENIIELGAWLGRSAMHFAQTIPDATIFSVDIWDNNYLLNDPHYNSSGENISILKNAPIFDQYMTNTWDHGYHPGQPTRPNRRQGAGIVPMRMDTLEALELVFSLNIEVQMIYIDANHHYDSVYKDVKLSVELFPTAHILGDDWDYPDVQRAAKDIAVEKGLKIHVIEGKCWSYSDDVVREVKRRRRDEAAEREFASAADIKAANEIAAANKSNKKKSFAQLLSTYKS